MFIFIDRMKYNKREKQKRLEDFLSINTACNNCKYFKRTIDGSFYCRLKSSLIFDFGRGITKCDYRKERKRR